MLLRSLKGLIAALFLPLLALTVSAQTAGIDVSQGLQMEFPTGGQLRIENDLGKVTAESWSQKYIYVTASGESGRSRLSSVVIENGKQGLIDGADSDGRSESPLRCSDSPRFRRVV